jgi:hypothetical protein
MGSRAEVGNVKNNRPERDAKETKARIREVLDELANRHGISVREVTYAIESYADDMLSDTIYEAERALEHEIEAHTTP